jgi:chromosome segregation ATPase
MMGFYDIQIAAAEAAEAALAEQRRLAELADGLNDLREKKRKAEELDRLWGELCQTQADLRANVAEALISVPAWREKFAKAHQELVNVVAELNAAQAGIVRAGDALRRAYKIERTIQGLEGRGETGSTIQRMWQSAGGDSPDLDPLRGLEKVDPGLPGWLSGRGIKFLYRSQIGIRHFFRG